MSRIPHIYMDSCCFIDMVAIELNLNRSKEIHDKVWFCKKMIIASQDGGINVYTSTWTINECLFVRETESQQSEKILNDEVKNLFRAILESGKSGVYPVDSTIFIKERARGLIWDYGLTGIKVADSIHIATAIEMECGEFITGDGRSILNKATELKDKFGIDVIKPQNTLLLPDKYRQTSAFENAKDQEK